MSKLNLLIFLNSFSDYRSTNNPNHNGIRWTRDLNAIPIQDAGSTMPFTLAPGESKTLFDTTRTTDQDGTTEYSITTSLTSPNSYVLTAVGGTLPNFRTPRVTGADATTQVNVTTNGPVATFSTPSSGTYASFTGLIAGMTSSVTITANTLGTSGNSVLLNGDGTSSINILISNWNIANPSNQITLAFGNGSQVPDAGSYASFMGVVPGVSTSVTITANVIGAGGNSVALTGDGTSSINTLITNWNTANPSNTIVLSAGDGTQVPNGATFASFTGTPAGLSTPITLTANTPGAAGNYAFLIGDGVSTIDTLIANWNISMPSNQMTLTAGNGAQILTRLTVVDLSGGTNASVINLSGGITIAIALSGGYLSTQFNLVSGGVVVGDLVRIGSLFNAQNQGEWKIIAVTATSFSVANPVAIQEGPYTLGAGFAAQIQIYSAAGVQVNDTIVISSGFSQVSWGSYSITAVAANWLQFYTNSILPQEGPITTEVAIYESSKRFVYLEADQNCKITINGTAVGTIEPWVIYNTTAPGQYMLRSTIYSMAVQNISTNGANLVMMSVE